MFPTLNQHLERHRFKIGDVAKTAVKLIEITGHGILSMGTEVSITRYNNNSESTRGPFGLIRLLVYLTTLLCLCSHRPIASTEVEK
jgi:hypothetical protein